MKKLYTLFTLTLLTLVLGGCDHDYFYSDLLGRWEKVAIIENGYEYELPRGEYEEYTFFDDGTGIYLNEFGTRVDFWWDEYSRERLRVRFSDGVTESLYYRIDGSYLELSDTYTFRNGRLFRYGGRARR